MNKTRSKSRQKWLKWSLIGVLCLAALVAAAVLEENWRAAREWEQFKTARLARGEKLDFKDFVPAQVTGASNFAFEPLVAASYEGVLDKDGHEIRPHTNRGVNRLLEIAVDDQGLYGEGGRSHGNWLLGRMTDLASWQAYYRTLPDMFAVPPQPRKPAQDILLALGKHDRAIEELREASKWPSRFPLNYGEEDPARFLQPHLLALKHCTTLLELRAAAELRNEQVDLAFQDVMLTFRLADTIHSEPFIDSQVSRIQMIQSAIQPIYEGMASNTWSDDQLMAFDAALAKLDFLKDYEWVMRADRAMRMSQIEYLRRTRDFSGVANNSDFAHFFGASAASFYRMAPRACFYRSERELASLYEQFVLPLVDADRHQVSSAAAGKLEARSAEIRSGPVNDVLARMFFSVLFQPTPKFVREQACVDLTRTAIALERYRRANHEYPASLDALVPQFADHVPLDVVDGKPLHYRREDNGRFILYSVGWDGRDDGGTMVIRKGTSVTDDTKGDIVWRYPSP